MQKTLFLFLISLPAFAASNDSGQQNGSIDKCRMGYAIESNATIAKNVDGDTVHVRTTSGTYSVRMLGVDTPETHFMGKSQGEWGERAAARTQELIPIGTQVRLEFSEESCDGHGRVLAFVNVGKANINLQLAKEGMAVNYCVAPTFEHCDEIGTAVAKAQAKKLGMFSDPKVELPYDFRRRMQNNEQRSYVGNWSTKEVLPPGNQNSVPVAQRVFFYSKEDIKEPFYLAN